MSLINEALKKAQTERKTDSQPHQTTAEAAAAAILSSHQQKPKRKRNFLWGFVISVLVVGLLASGISLILVNQLFTEEESYQHPPAAAQQKPSLPPTAAIDAPSAEKVTPVPASSGPNPAPAAMNPAAQSPASAAQTVVQPPPAAVATPSATPTPPTPPPSSAAKPRTQAKPNPEVWARLEELEIRGIMPGGSKVLIFDKRTGQNKTFQTGDMLDGSLGMRLGNLSPNQIEVEDYGGYIYTKSF